MVKNLSNPLNARKVAQLLEDDAIKQGYEIDSRKVSVFFSDNRIQDLGAALKQLKQRGLIADDYYVSPSTRDLLLSQEFIGETTQVTKEEAESTNRPAQVIDEFNTLEFQTQLQSLKSKLLKSWSGGISVEAGEFENFDRKFARPMKYFVEFMDQQGIKVTELQAFTVVYATDYLSLGDNSKEDIFYLTFSRFDSLRDILDTEFSYTYQWPEVSGTSFIEIGKNFTVIAEIAEFAKSFKSVSGIDTYPDKVILAFFLELLSGEMLEEMVKKKIIYRWAGDDPVDDPRNWLFPPPEYHLDTEIRTLIEQVTITHTLLVKILPEPPEFLTLLRDTKKVAPTSRGLHLAKKLESSLTRKAVALQFGTTLANFFENFKTNPAKVTPFLDTTLRYYTKSDLQTVLTTTEHNIKTGIKNTTGIIKKYIKEMSDDDLNQAIGTIMGDAVSLAYKELKSQTSTNELDGSTMFNPPVNTASTSLDTIADELEASAEESKRAFFTVFLDYTFTATNQFARDLEPQREAPETTEGGLQELVQDFLSTTNYHGRKNPQAKQFKEHMIEQGLPAELSEQIAYVTSYTTYQVASKSGSNGSSMHESLVSHFSEKAIQLRDFSLKNGTSLKDIPQLDTFLQRDLQQAHVIVALASKIKSDAYNAWTPLDTAASKSAQFLNEFMLPNLFYWQRIPRELITSLRDKDLLDGSDIKSLVRLTQRHSLIEAYCLLVMAAVPSVNSMGAAEQYLMNAFGSSLDSFQLAPRQGEAEIAQEAVFLWNRVMEEN